MLTKEAIFVKMRVNDRQNIGYPHTAKAHQDHNIKVFKPKAKFYKTKRLFLCKIKAFTLLIINQIKVSR